MAGTLLAGRISARLPFRRGLVLLCGIHHLPALVYLALATWTPASPMVVAAAILAEQFAYGMGTIGVKLILLRFASEGPYRTAHFSYASALSGVAAVASGMFSGALQQAIGYQAFFSCVVAVSILVVLVPAGLGTHASERLKTREIGHAAWLPRSAGPPRRTRTASLREHSWRWWR